MENLALKVGQLIERVHSVAGYERSTVCARDCMYQWDVGGDELLEQTIQVWNERVKDISNGETSFCDCERHGAWVPAIPL
jgi:hypothetical protein